MRLFKATVVLTLKTANALKAGGEELLVHLEKTVKAESPDKARYAAFFDLDDILAHMSAMFADKPWATNLSLRMIASRGAYYARLR